MHGMRRMQPVTSMKCVLVSVSTQYVYTCIHLRVYLDEHAYAFARIYCVRARVRSSACVCSHVRVNVCPRAFVCAYARLCMCDGMHNN